MTTNTDAAPAIPALMGRMAATLGVVPGQAFSPGEIATAAGRCEGCSDKPGCRDWLELAAIRGADRPPSLCANHDLFVAAVSDVETL